MRRNGQVAQALTRIETLESRLGIVSESFDRSVRFASPALWNDTGQPPSAPVGTPRELLAQGAGIEKSIARFRTDPAINRVIEWGVDGAERCALEDTQPIPAATDRVGYHPHDDLAYWLSGLGDYLLVDDAARALDRPLSAGGKALDFGCATGRVLRHFKTMAPGVRAFGIDICPQYVAWARQHLWAPVLQGTALPTLPFADSTFDVIFAGSVFTHINEFEEAWLAELRRVLAPDGLAVLTVHSQHAWQSMASDAEHPLRQRTLEIPHRLEPLEIAPVVDATLSGPMPAERIALTALDWPSINMFHSHTYIHERWGRFFTVERIIPSSHGYQDSVILTGG